MFSFGIIAQPCEGEATYMANDVVFQALQITEPMSKRQIEYQQVLHYQDVAARAFPSLSFDIDVEALTRPANESPDFYIRRDGLLIGLDATEFSFATRRGTASRFNVIRQSLRDAFSRGRLKGCAGTSISLELANREVDGERALAKHVAELIESMDMLRVTPEVAAQFKEFEVDAIGLGPYPIGESGSIANGSIKWTVQSVFDGPLDLAGMDVFARECGFFVEHYYRQTVTLSEVKAELDRIISSHDKSDTQRIDELLIVSSGPDKFGNAVGGDTAAVLWFLRGGGEINAPTRLKRVVLDAWGANKIVVLYERPNEKLNHA